VFSLRRRSIRSATEGGTRSINCSSIGKLKTPQRFVRNGERRIGKKEPLSSESGIEEARERLTSVEGSEGDGRGRGEEGKRGRVTR
jgi:hypothetical protein